MTHTIRHSSGFAHAYRDKDGLCRQGPYVVRLACDCGFLIQAPIEEIETVWKTHLEVESE